jgi:hypothetical protein
MKDSARDHTATGVASSLPLADAVTQQEADAEFEATMELTQLRAGDKLTAATAAAIQRLFQEHSDEIERGAVAFAEGERKGREEAGGVQTAILLERIDLQKIELAAEGALKRFYLAGNTRLRDALEDKARVMAGVRDSWGKAEGRVAALTGTLKALWTAHACGTDQERLTAMTVAGDFLARIGALDEEANG